MREDDFRKLLDDYGILRPGALEPPPRTKCFAVFAQRADARVEAGVWERHAAQFFDATLLLSVSKQYLFDAPPNDAAQVTLAIANRPEVTRLCYGRPREDDDLRAAEDADVRQGAAGLGRLAKRCASLWLVEAEGEDDEASLRIAAILASVVLGPILTPGGARLLGVRSARAELDALGGPYR